MPTAFKSFNTAKLFDISKISTPHPGKNVGFGFGGVGSQTHSMKEISLEVVEGVPNEE